jgi:aromatic-L-amino-acid decarboxylase
MDPASFRRHGHELVDWIAAYLESAGRYPVLSRNRPGDIVAALPDQAPDDPEAFDVIMSDFERVVLPGITHWNHPAFLAYFATTGSEPGVLAEFLSAALNQQAMLWRTSPAATELEFVSLAWLRRLIGVPETFEGVIYDTASISTLHALAAARERAVPDVRSQGLAGRQLPAFAVYCSEQAHSSVDKAVMAIGLGHASLRRIATDAEFRLIPELLSQAIAQDRAAGVVPLAVVATVGTTSTTSVDPLPEVAEICVREDVWLHVDAAYAGVAAMLPSHRHILAGVEHADSLVVNPHKWLFTPFDLSAFYCRRMDLVRSAFALTPEYLRTSDAPAAKNLMDTGIQLGRRFRALKLWMILRTFGASGLRSRLQYHMQLARRFADWVDVHPSFTRVAPVPFSVICFRWTPSPTVLTDDQVDALNADLLDAINASGDVFISHTKLRDRYVLRVAIGHERTGLEHIERAWQLITSEAERIQATRQLV